MTAAEQDAYRQQFESSIKILLSGATGTALDRCPSSQRHYDKPYVQAAWETYLALARKYEDAIPEGTQTGRVRSDRPNHSNGPNSAPRITDQATDLDAFEKEYARAFGLPHYTFFQRSALVGDDVFTGVNAGYAYRGWLVAKASLKCVPPPSLEAIRPFIEGFLEDAKEPEDARHHLRQAERIIRTLRDIFFYEVSPK